MNKTPNLPDDVKKECIAIVQGYDRRVKKYNNLRREIVEGGGGNYVVLPDPKNPEDWKKTTWAFNQTSHNASRTTEDKAAKLLGLEELPDTKRMRAVEKARDNIGLDLPPQLRRKLVKAVMLNCKSGRKYPYKVLDVEGFSERSFYRERDLFLLDIAEIIGLL